MLVSSTPISSAEKCLLYQLNPFVNSISYVMSMSPLHVLVVHRRSQLAPAT